METQSMLPAFARRYFLALPVYNKIHRLALPNKLMTLVTTLVLSITCLQAGAEAPAPWQVDNGDAGTSSTGNWSNSSHAPGYIGSGYQLIAKNTVVVNNTIDTDQATMVGAWTASTYSNGFIGANYFHAAKGNGELTLTWPVAGDSEQELSTQNTNGHLTFRKPVLTKYSHSGPPVAVTLAMQPTQFITLVHKPRLSKIKKRTGALGTN